MTARLVRLRIAGFKSFAEPVSLDILPGLTGIVGPNGCGKSNVADALRWAMGETSARSLRGGEMDDVIFAGSHARASRNLAEVGVSLEAAPGGLPTPFEAEAELQVTRRLERGAGSTFRANGRELRARDVQTLYADLASGARSSGMVSQGRVAALVAARPEERRQVLEEAAGIAGLHARRHEAELKLRAAEQNMARAGDAQAQLETARESLRRQARQAARYRAISDLVRAAEAEHLAVLHGRATAAQGQARSALDAARSALDVAEQEQETAAAAIADAEAALPQPRQREADARSVLERRRLEAGSLARDAHRAQADHAAALARLQDVAADLAASDRAWGDARDCVARLEGECARLDAERLALPDRIRTTTDAARKARCALQTCQAEADATAAQASAATEQAADAAALLRSASARLAELRTRQAAAAAECAACAGLRVPPEALDEACARQARAEAAIGAARAAVHAAEAARADTAARAEAAGRHAAEQHASRRQAERARQACAGRLAEAHAAWSQTSASLARLEGEHVGEACLVEADRVAEAAEARLAEAEAAIEVAELVASSARAEAAQASRVAEADAAAAEAAHAARDAAGARLALLSGEAEEARRAWARAENGPPDRAEIEAASLALAAAEAARARADETARQAGSRSEEAAQAAALSRAMAAELGIEVARLSAEAAGLEAALGPERQDGVLSDLHPPTGLEAAVGAALGMAARSPLDQEAPAFWRALHPLRPPPPPPGTVALASLIRAPAALGRALSHAVLLDEATEGEGVQGSLAPGMVAVDRAGACWRWDGHVTRAGAPDQVASRLLLRRRQEGVSAALRVAQDAVRQAQAGSAERASAAAEAQAEAGQAAAALQQAGLRHEAALTEVEALRDAARRRDEQVASLSHAAERRQAELEEAARRAADAEASCVALPASDPVLAARLEAVAATCQGALEAARTRRLSCRTQAMEQRRAAQMLAGEAVRTGTLIRAETAALARAAAGLEAARRGLTDAEAVVGDLPDLAALDTTCARLADAMEIRRAEEAAARAARVLADSALEAARRTATELLLAHGQAETRWAALTELAERAVADLAVGEQELATAECAWRGSPDAAGLHGVAQAARERFDAARMLAARADAASDAVAAALAQVERTAPSLEAELGAWRARLGEAASRQKTLADRHEAARAESASLAARPAELAAEVARVEQALATASAAHQAAALALDAAHGLVRALASAERDAAREAGSRAASLGRAQAAVEAACLQLGEVARRIAERLGGGASVPHAPDLSDQALDRALRRMERLGRERDEMGPVNLRAELEVAELDERLAALSRDQEELATAIAKLRGAIGHLNREGRERLQTVFSQVDQHFRTLFTRMMGGGQARLAWTGSDDPLLAGLDIFAQPPGKKLTSLSLLSGGEQALTALSLIFAVFRCTPAPVCVLDEVDAPLDDANVDRFCTLLEEMARETGTSFLVVTHHQLTMSRMDRLYGVTMQERGVSRLLSVDLSGAVAMAEPVRAAAE